MEFIDTLQGLLDDGVITTSTRFNLILSSGQTYKDYRLLYETSDGVMMMNDDDTCPVIVNKNYIMSIEII